jgi:hypothetical protein
VQGREGDADEELTDLHGGEGALDAGRDADGEGGEGVVDVLCTYSLACAFCLVWEVDNGGEMRALTIMV